MLQQKSDILLGGLFEIFTDIDGKVAHPFEDVYLASWCLTGVCSGWAWRCYRVFPADTK